MADVGRVGMDSGTRAWSAPSESDVQIQILHRRSRTIRVAQKGLASAAQAIRLNHRLTYDDLNVAGRGRLPARWRWAGTAGPTG